MEIKEYQAEVHKDLWDTFVKDAKNSLFMHYRNYIEYHADRFTDNSLLFYENDTLIALLPLNVKDSILYSHGGLTFGGFIVSSKMKTKKMLDCFDLLKKYMYNRKLNKLIYKPTPYIYHNAPSEDDLYALYRNNANLLKFEPSTTIYLKNQFEIPKGRKAQIARAKREGVIVEFSNNYYNFMELENKILKERYDIMAVHAASELIKLQLLFPENIKLYIAKYNNEMIAGTILFEYDNIVHTQYLAADEKAREIGALDYIINGLIEKYNKSKEYFDFGISTEDDGLFLNEGLISQKEGFGGRTIVYQTWEINL